MNFRLQGAGGMYVNVPTRRDLLRILKTFAVLKRSFFQPYWSIP